MICNLEWKLDFCGKLHYFNKEKGKIGDEWGHVPVEEEILFKITSETFAH